MSRKAVPATHSTHCDALVIGAVRDWFWCLPEGHGKGDDAPSSQKLPASHCLHAVAPTPSWYSPAGQLGHTSWPGASAYVPFRLREARRGSQPTRPTREVSERCVDGKADAFGFDLARRTTASTRPQWSALRTRSTSPQRKVGKWCSMWRSGWPSSCPPRRRSTPVGYARRRRSTHPLCSSHTKTAAHPPCTCPLGTSCMLSRRSVTRTCQGSTGCSCLRSANPATAYTCGHGHGIRIEDLEGRNGAHRGHLLRGLSVAALTCQPDKEFRRRVLRRSSSVPPGKGYSREQK